MSFQDSYKLALESVAAGDITPMMLFPIGNFKSAKYPELPLTRELADEVIANFAGGVLGTEPVVDSSGAHDTSAPAAAWVKRVYVAPTTDGGEAAFADVEWTEVGAQKVSDREYQYNSVELGPVVDNLSGVQTDNVLRSVTLTNTPVIRLLPKVLDAGDSIAEPVTVALSEITLADPPPDPVQSILDDMDALAAKADATMKGKKGMPDMRAMMRQARVKVSAHSLAEAGSVNDQREALGQALNGFFGAMHEGLYVEDFGPDWVVFHTWSAGMSEGHYYRADYAQDPTSGTAFSQPVEVERDTTYVPVSDSNPAGTQTASSKALSQDAKAAEGRGAQLSEGDAAQKGADPMKTVIQLLKLSENADEPAIHAAVVALSEHAAAETKRANVAEEKVTEVEKSAHAQVIETRLTELIDGGHVLPGQKAEWLKLAEEAPASFDAFAENAKKVKAIELGEAGTSKSGAEMSDDPTIELDERAKKLAEERHIGYGEAQIIALSEDPALAARYDNRPL